MVVWNNRYKPLRLDHGPYILGHFIHDEEEAYEQKCILLSLYIIIFLKCILRSMQKMAAWLMGSTCPRSFIFKHLSFQVKFKKS